MNTASDAPRRPAVAYLYPGPRWWLEHEFRTRLTALQRHVRPLVFTSAKDDEQFVIGDAEVVAIGYRSKAGLRRIWYYLRYLAACHRALSAFRRRSGGLDAIVTYDPLATGLIAWLMKLRFGCKLICEVNGVFDDDALYGEGGITSRASRWTTLAIVRFVLGRSDGIRLLFDGQIADHLPAGAPTLVLFEQVELGHFHEGEGDRKILAVGAPFFIKGFDYLVRAFGQVADEFPDWELVIVGYFVGEEQAIDKVMANAPRVRLHEAVRHMDLPELMAECEIFVLPSRSEAMGRVMLEAAAAGKARVGARVGGIPTTINDGEDGLLFERGDVQGLADALRRLMQDAGLRARLGREAKHRVEQEFTADRYADLYAAFINDVCRGD